MKQKLKKLKPKAEKPVPVIPSGLPLKSSAFYFPVAAEPAVAFVGSVLQARMDEKGVAKKYKKDSDSDSILQNAFIAKIYTMTQKGDKIRPEFPMTKHEDRDDRPTYKGDYDLRRHKDIRVQRMSPGYALHPEAYAAEDIIYDSPQRDAYVKPRQAPRPQSPPVRHFYPASPFAAPIHLPLHIPDDPSTSSDVSEYTSATNATPTERSTTPCMIEEQAPSAPPTPPKPRMQPPRYPHTPSKSLEQTHRGPPTPSKPLGQVPSDSPPPYKPPKLLPSLRDVLKPVYYHDIPADMRGDLIPPGPNCSNASNVDDHDRHARLRSKLAQEKQAKMTREAERERERKTRKPSEESVKSNSACSSSVASMRSKCVWPSEAVFHSPSPYHESEINGLLLLDNSSKIIWPSEADFPPPRAQWTKPERTIYQEQSQDKHDISSAAVFNDSEHTDDMDRDPRSPTKKVFDTGPVDASTMTYESDALLNEGVWSRSVVDNSSSTSSQGSGYATTPRPNMPTHARTISSRKAVFFTPDQISKPPPMSPPAYPPPPTPKNVSDLAEIPPFLKSRSQTEPATPARYGLGRGAPPGLGIVSPLQVHKRNPSNPQNSRPVFDYASVTTYHERNVSNTSSQHNHSVFDYASVTTSRPGRKHEGPPPVLRHRPAVPLVGRPSRLESLPINVKSNARPSISTTKFRTDTHEEATPSVHNRTTSEFGKLTTHPTDRDPISRNDVRPAHNRSQSDFTQFTLKASLHTRAAWGSFSSYAATAPPVHRTAVRPGHTRQASGAIPLPSHPAVYVPRAAPYRANTTA